MSNAPTSFTMYGAREILKLAGNADYLQRQIELLEQAVAKTPELAVDLARALIETVCKTILEDRGIQLEKDWLNNTPRLFENTLKHIVLLPDEHKANSKATLGIEATVEGLQKTVLGLCQFRNSVGIASHGKDGYTHPMDSLQAVFAARAADSVVCFLFSAHKRYPASPSTGRLYYLDCAEFNEYIDDQYEVIEVGASTYLVSEILYHVDIEAYRAAYIEFIAEKSEQEIEDVTTK